jgi:ketosteroid isomerase-like protein
VAREDVEVVLDQFAAVNERNFERAMSLYAEDVELVVDPRAFLEGGTFKGRDAVGEWFGKLVPDLRARLPVRHRGGAGPR